MAKEKVVETKNESDDATSRKPERFFAHLNELKDFMVTVYKVGEKNKKIKMEVFENIVPNDMTDIRDVYGPGTYHFYCHELLDGKTGDLLDYTMVHLGGQPILDSGPIVSETEQKTLTQQAQEMMVFKELFGANHGESAVLTDAVSKMMQAQQEMAMKHASLMQEQMSQMMRAQLESEKRFSQMIEKISEKKSGGTNDLLETIQLVDQIRSGGSGGDSSLVDKLINSPLAQPLVESFLNAGAMQNPEVPQIPSKELPEKVFTAIDYVNNIPIDVQKKITSETREKHREQILKNNDMSETLVDEILDRIITNNSLGES